jgi:hypothetical protein
MNIILTLYLLALSRLNTISAQPLVSCNICVDPKNVTKPDAELIGGTCGDLDRIARGGIPQDVCNGYQGSIQEACGCQVLTGSPTRIPTSAPIVSTRAPTSGPTSPPTTPPTFSPTTKPTRFPTNKPTLPPVTTPVSQPTCKASCNFCVDPKKVTKPNAKITVINIGGIVRRKVTCRYWDDRLRRGVTRVRCLKNQNDESIKTTCGCA